MGGCSGDEGTLLLYKGGCAKDFPRNEGAYSDCGFVAFGGVEEDYVAMQELLRYRVDGVSTLEDVTPLLRPEIEFDPHKAYALVYEKLIDRIPGKRD